MAIKPMLDDLELQLVQQIEADEQQVRAQHAVPTLEGDFLQPLGRRAERITLNGILTPDDDKAVGEKLKSLREKFRAAQPVPFAADIATATQIDTVLIEEMSVRELAGKPERFEYAFALREYIPAPPPEEEKPPPPTPPLVTELIVKVIVQGQTNFDFSKVTVTISGQQADGTSVNNRHLTNRNNDTWTETDFPPGSYTVTATVTDPPPMSGSETKRVPEGQKTTFIITLVPGSVSVIAKTFMVHFRFDNAFVEPCMREVLKQVAQYANDHSNEKLLIVGNTDAIGSPGNLTESDPYNQSLSERRARSVFAYLTFGREAGIAAAEWNELRQRHTAVPTLRDQWGVHQYQYMLQDLGFYPDNVDGRHEEKTDAAVQAYRQAKGLPAGNNVDDTVWQALISDYMGQDNLSVPESQFLPNSGANCNSGILKWLGCATQDPVLNQHKAWRPNRRVELLFAQTDSLPCNEPEPDTFNLPTPGAVNASWCLGPGRRTQRACFVVKHLPAGGTPQHGEWLRQPAEPGSVIVKGLIEFEDGTPAGNVRYVLIAPDGEFLDGERANGEGVEGRTQADGTFEYPTKPKGIGIYTMEIHGRFVARLKGEPVENAKGNVVCKRLDGSEDFEVAVASPATTFDLQVSNAVQIGGSTSRVFLATRAATEDVVITAVFPPGTLSASRDITWVGGTESPGNPLERLVSRASVGQTTVTATLSSNGVTRSREIFVVRVTLDVDADRDGSVEEDGEGKNSWEYGVAKKGAVILCNNDDDNSNRAIDNINRTIDGASDIDDLAPLIVRQSGNLPAGVRLELSVDDKEKIRIFNPRSTAGTAIIGPSPLTARAAITGSTTSDLELGMEATQYPDAGSHGLCRLRLALKEGSTELANDEVQVRVAPWVMPSHLEITEEIYVVEMAGFNTAPDSPFVDDIQAAATAAGIPLVRVNGTTVGNDQWIQDSMEVGYSQAPMQTFSVVLNAVNRRDLETFARNRLLGSNYGLHQLPFNRPPRAFNTFDSHGNLEVSPPVTVGGKEFKFGKIYHGKGRPSTPFNSRVKAFLQDQQIQEPFEIDTDWLGVGHDDEIISFVPSAVGKPFRLLIASTDEAIRILTGLRDAGHGDLTLFTTKTIAHLRTLVQPGDPIDSNDHFHERTINNILSDTTLLTRNSFCQTQLDTTLTRMVTELGLSLSTDVIKVPSLFVEEPLFPGHFAALIPGMVNMLVITRPAFGNTQLLLPKPFGPVLAGVDQLEQDMLDRLMPLGYSRAQIHFIDDFDTYHINLGEVHCGTNSKRQAHSVPWWEHEP